MAEISPGAAASTPACLLQKVTSKVARVDLLSAYQFPLGTTTRVGAAAILAGLGLLTLFNVGKLF